MLAANVTKLANDSFILLSAAAETGDRVDGATKSTLQPQKGSSSTNFRIQ